MIKYFLKMPWLFLLSAAAMTYAQKNEPLKISSIPAPYDFFVGTDDYDNPYFIKDNALIKQTKDQIFEYKNVSLGKIDKIDLQNPLKIILFYYDFNCVIALDNQLNEISQQKFADLSQVIFPLAIGIAAQNKMWIFDSLTQKIGLFDYLTLKFQELTPSLSTEIIAYSSDFNYFRWIDQNRILYTCDVFGKITTTTLTESFDSVQIIDNNKILLQQNNSLSLLELNTSIKNEIKIIEKISNQFMYKNQILTIFTDKKLNRYKVNLE